MLKKIAVRQLRLGMHVHKLEGRWIEHPFWKTRFVLDSADDLKRLQTCGVRECWIDIRLGLDVATPAAEAPAAPVRTASGSASSPAAPTPSVPPPPARPLDEELRQAAAICQRGREAVIAMFGEARMGRSIDATGCLPLVDEITQSVQRNPGALVSLARLKSQDDYTYMHSVAVCALMVALGRQIGLDDAQCREAGLAGLMHDVGKAMLPLEILNKPGKLTEDEWKQVRMHPQWGADLIQGGQGAHPSVLDVALCHHERMDGRGYPQHLPAERISRLARMGAICDVYDAITSNRPYKAGWDPAESIARMASWKGQFDEPLFAAFVQSLGIYPTGSVVKLSSERLAVVSEQNAQSLVAPVVKVFYSLRSQMPMSPLRLDLAQPGCNERIVGRHAAARGEFPHLDAIWAGQDVLTAAGR